MGEIGKSTEEPKKNPKKPQRAQEEPTNNPEEPKRSWNNPEELGRAQKIEEDPERTRKARPLKGPSKAL